MAFRDLTVLVVEDDRATLSALKACLAFYGCNAAALPSTKAASLPVQAVPCCAIIDMQLPNRAALQAALDDRWPGLPVILSSKQADVPTAVEAMRSGAADFLPKPITPNALLQILTEACGSCSPAKPPQRRA